MTVGNMYFLKDEYFIDFPDPYLEKNKERDEKGLHNRPCFFSFSEKDRYICWLVPFSSNIKKYKKVYDSKIAKQGYCDTICFGDVLGFPKAFLIQNMCPATQDYINDIYEDKNSNPVRVDGVLEKKLIQQSSKVLALIRNGFTGLVFPDILNIEAELLKKK